MATIPPIDPGPGCTFRDLRDWIEERDTTFALTPGFGDFYASLSPEESARVEQLWAVVRALSDGRPGVAQTMAEYLVRTMPDEDDGAGAVSVRTFAEALLGRIVETSVTGGNLYLGARPPGAQLRAFELLRLRTPLIPFAYAAANRALFGAIDEPTDVTLLDIGIGRGGQVQAFLRNPMARTTLKSLHVIGVEPDSSEAGTGALQVARSRALDVASEVGIPTTFAGISKRAEVIARGDIETAGPRGLMLANSAFALHHIDHRGGEGNDRDGVLRILRESGAEAIVLVEPDSNHFVDDLTVRFLFAYRHYRTVATSLRSMLTPAEAFTVWTEFFAPEVRNVMTHEGAERSERHEESGRWARRLESTGWTIESLDKLVPTSGTPPGFSLTRAPHAFSLSYQGVGLLSVVRATR